MACTSALLKSFQIILNEKMVSREQKKEVLMNEIRALEYEIVKIIEDIKHEQAQLTENEKSSSIKNESPSTEDECCLIKMLHEDYEEEMEKRKIKFQQISDRKRCAEVKRMTKKIKEQVLQAKERNLKVCLSCGCLAADLAGCTGCGDAFYCNERCQQQHWNVHRHFCLRNNTSEA